VRVLPHENRARRAKNLRSLLAAATRLIQLILLFAKLLAGTLARQRLLHAALRTRLQVEGVTLHFFNDVFRLNLALKSPQGVLDRFALLQSDFCQFNHPPAGATLASLSLYYSAPLCRNSTPLTTTDKTKPRLRSGAVNRSAPRSRAQDPARTKSNVYKERLTLDSRIFVQCPIQDGRSHPLESRAAPNLCTQKPRGFYR
jgi:hypothetical protein